MDYVICIFAISSSERKKQRDFYYLEIILSVAESEKERRNYSVIYETEEQASFDSVAICCDLLIIVRKGVDMMRKYRVRHRAGGEWA